ncbi:MAG: hypothetical protein JO037_23745 [Actinobacteria bacterium]|nr:hypothetical protein [Actinomycetota bacterium]
MPARPARCSPAIQEDALDASVPLSRDGRWIWRPGRADLPGPPRRGLGCSAFVVPDHLIGQYAAMPLLAVIAVSGSTA